MKKILLLSLSVLTSIGMVAQQKTERKVSENTEMKMNKSAAVMEKAQIDLAQKRAQQQSNAKKTRSGAGWMSAQDAAFITGTSSAVLCPVYQDSTIRVFNANPVDSFHWWIHAVGTSFDPVSNHFYSPLNTGYDNVFQVSNTSAYSVDSIQVVGKYYRRAYNNYTDTLIIEIAPSTATNVTTLQSKDEWYKINLNLSDSTLRWATPEYDNVNNNMVSPNKIVIKKILDAAAANDTTANGLNSWAFKLPSPLSVLPGGKVAVLCSYKSGHNYAFGAKMDSVNYWRHLAQEMNGNATLPTVYTGELETGTFCTSDDKYKLMDGANPKYVLVSGKQYVPTTYWYLAPLTYEDFYFNFYVSCPTCGAVGVENVDLGIDMNVYPNPATDNITFNFTLENNSDNTTIELSNMLGQNVKSLKVGHISAGSPIRTEMNVSDVPAGLYIYTINANGKKLSDKILIK
jgi:hypothetical protein